jgi:hypothetical protein
MLNDWMLIRGHPDFLILQWAGPSAARKLRIGLKPEVQGLWAGYVEGRASRPSSRAGTPDSPPADPRRLMPEMPHARENHGQAKTVSGLDDLLVAH